MHVAQQLLARGDTVVGIDNLNDYYDPALKDARLALLQPQAGFRFQRLDIADRPAMEAFFAKESFDRVVHLAAQAGVRYSIQNPHAYADSNLIGFVNVLEGCRQNQVQHLVYASSSSIYGSNTKMPFSESDPIAHPVSLYGATKKANELMAHAYSHLYGLPTTGLRFFTVYGPWGRPDMAYFLFVKAILEGRPIDVFNEGRMQRDFTYIDDITEGIVRVLDKPASANPHFDPALPDPSSSYAPYRLYNIGNHQPVELLEFISIIEKRLGKRAVLKLLPMKSGDVVATFASTEQLQKEINFSPATPLEKGIHQFVDWFVRYHAHESA